MFNHDLCTLPSVKGLLEGIRDKVWDDAVSLQILVTPPGMDPQILVDGFTSLLDLQHVEPPVHVDCSKLQGAKNVNNLASFFLSQTNESSDFHTIQDVLEYPQYPEIILLKELASVPTSGREKVFDLIYSYADQVASLDRTSSNPRFVLLTESASVLPDISNTPEPWLDIKYFFAYPSSLELRLLSREYTGNSLPEEARWTEALLDGVAAGDPHIGRLMIENPPEDVEGVMQILRTVAPQRGADLNAQEDLRFREVTREKPSQSQLRQWSKGLVIASQEYGLEEHPCVLAEREQKGIIEQRIWRGQAQFVLPLADRFRIRVTTLLDSVYQKEGPWYEHLGDKLGSHLSDAPPAGGKSQLERLCDDPLDAELGYLQSLAVKNSRRKRDGFGEWDRYIHEVLRCRNKISHYKLLSKDEFISFIKVANTPFGQVLTI